MKKLLLLFLCWFCVTGFAQTKVVDSAKTDVLTEIDQANGKPKLLKLNPVRAGLYSAVLPGLGQVYNHKYWKIPIVWGAVGTGIGFIIYNNNQYKRYRADFIAELNGVPEEYSYLKINNPGLDLVTILGNEQDSAKRYRDYAIAATALVYILNVIDAIVDAHLYEGRHDKDLSFTPAIMPTPVNTGSNFGISMNYKF